jgi:WD40 repeat protein
MISDWVDTNRVSYGAEPVHTIAIAGDYAFALSGQSDLHMWWLGGLSHRALIPGATAFAVRADGLRVVAGDRHGFVEEWDTEMAVGRKPAPPVNFSLFRGRIRHFQAHEWDAITCVAMSRDGGRVVTGSADKLRVWSVDDGRELQVLEGHAGRIRDVHMSSNGRRAVSTASDGTVRIWTLGATEIEHHVRGHVTGVDAVAIRGGRGISISRDGELRAWDVASGVTTLRTGTSTRASEYVGPHIVAAALSSDGQRAAWAGERLISFDLEQRMEHRAAIDLWRVGAHSAVSADARRAVTASGDRLRLWDLDSMSVIREIPSDGEVLSLAFTPDGRLAVVGQWSLVRLIDVDSGAEVISFTTDQYGIDSVAASANAGRVVAETLDGALLLWDLRPPRAATLFRGTGRLVHTSFGKRAAITGDGRLAATGSAIGVVRVWNEDDPEHRHNELRGHRWPTTAITLTSRGTRLAVAYADNTVSVWNTGTGEELAIARLDGLPCTMDAEGHQLLVGDLDGDVLCFEYVEPDLADIWRKAELADRPGRHLTDQETSEAQLQDSNLRCRLGQLLRSLVRTSLR